MEHTTFSTTFPLGSVWGYEGFDVTVVGVGTVHRAGAPVPAVLIDLGLVTHRLVGNETYDLTPFD